MEGKVLHADALGGLGQLTVDPSPVRHSAVLGHPIGHSLSPVLHRAAYASVGLPWTFDAIDVTEATLPGFLASRDASWAGLSLTMPLKQCVGPLLTSTSRIAQLTGAVNTVVFDWSGTERLLRGDNTDVVGIVRAIQEAPHASPLSDVPALVLGAGATAASALVAIHELGLVAVDVLARTPAKAEPLHRIADAVGIDLRIRSLSEWPARHAEASLVVSTLPSGAADPLADAVRAGAELLPMLLDVAYAQRPTTLGRSWTMAGGTCISGERMLLHQAVEQVVLVTGHQPVVSEMDAALRRALEGAP